ncbi:4849_t:CDS:2 [Cetraspora pellucida]|uniref:4849_t:CDS:1 n=1 Tax=Cetraspora pellucida TaxID=1433469 RepID=A0A9N9CSZ2_9GLOM|nr:4849_t:CDS:2 [Cetraspora pellucida]
MWARGWTYHQKIQPGYLRFQNAKKPRPFCLFESNRISISRVMVIDKDRTLLDR